jgi:hypothetical protein
VTNSSTSDDKDDDLFAAIARERGLLPPGEYIGELMVALPFATKRTEGQEATIKITEGRYANRLVTIRFMETGPPSCDGIIAGHAAILEGWWTELGVKGRPSRREGFGGVLKRLWQEGQGGKELTFVIDISSGRFAENILREVRWDLDFF